MAKNPLKKLESMDIDLVPEASFTDDKKAWAAARIIHAIRRENVDNRVDFTGIDLGKIQNHSIAGTSINLSTDWTGTIAVGAKSKSGVSFAQRPSLADFLVLAGSGGRAFAGVTLTVEGHGSWTFPYGPSADALASAMQQEQYVSTPVFNGDVVAAEKGKPEEETILTFVAYGDAPHSSLYTPPPPPSSYINVCLRCQEGFVGPFTILGAFILVNRSATEFTSIGLASSQPAIMTSEAHAVGDHWTGTITGDHINKSIWRQGEQIYGASNLSANFTLTFDIRDIPVAQQYGLY